MMRMSGPAVLFLTAATLLCCHRRELYVPYDDGADIIVYADWSDTPLTPEGWTVLFYPEDGSGPWKKVSNLDSAKVNLPVGTYNVLVFNETVTDFDDIVFRDAGSYDRFTAYVPAASSGSYMVCEPPEVLAVWTAERFTVTDAMVETTHHIRDGEPVPQERVGRLRIWARPAVVTSTVEMKVHVNRLSSASSIGGYLDGFADAVRMHDGRPSDDVALYRLTFTDRTFTTFENGYVTASFCSFGFRSGEADTLSGYTFDIRVSLTDGTAYRERVGIDSCITHHAGPWRDTVIRIEVGPFTLPDVGGGGGWEVGMDEWDGRDVPVTLSCLEDGRDDVRCPLPCPSSLPLPPLSSSSSTRTGCRRCLSCRAAVRASCTLS